MGLKTRATPSWKPAKRVMPFCVTIDPDGHDYLPMLFGAQGVLVHRPQDLARRLTRARGRNWHATLGGADRPSAFRKTVELRDAPDRRRLRATPFKVLPPS